MAWKWQSAGAKRLHIIDLDGAASGKPQNIKVVQSIVEGINIPVQLGGGIRDNKTVKQLWEIGVRRVILGTAAIENPELVTELCNENAEGVMVSIDARDGYVAIRGWLDDTRVQAIQLAQQVKEMGVKRILYTDINRDGTLTEPGYNAIGNLIKTVGIPVVAAGGISRISHLQKLAELGVDGAVVGRAIYTGDIDLKEALSSIK
jgi:phosphoribosylformimino-5-aminoimidazole carboxamide ribotide isomerase